MLLILYNITAYPGICENWYFTRVPFIKEGRISWLVWIFWYKTFCIIKL